MAFGTQDNNDDLMNEINMTPMVDVMLVLLIVFMVTLPVMNQAMNIKLPQTSSQPAVAPEPKLLELAIRADGSYALNGKDTSPAELQAAFANAAQQEPQPQLRIQGDKAVAYDAVAQAMSWASRAGLGNLAFVTEEAAATAP